MAIWSLVHGHQQIGFSNVMPRGVCDNWRFKQRTGRPRLVVPYFNRRPFDMMLLIKDVSKSYLHQLTDAQITAVADGWRDALQAIMWLMPSIGRETALDIFSESALVMSGG